MKLSKNQSLYKGYLISWNEINGYFTATFHDFFYKKGVGFKGFKTEKELKSKIDEMIKQEDGV